MTIGEILEAALDAPGRLRYGVPTSTKERLALQQALPGAPRDMTADQDAANRYASGFLFGREHPQIAAAVQPIVSRLKVSDLPFFGGSSPELQSQADYGVQQGINASDRGMTLADILGGD